jgi:GNAT superfamily N-acetyltransferase
MPPILPALASPRRDTNIGALHEVCWLDDLWIEPAWIGKGIGTSLFQRAAEHGRRLGAKQMEWKAERHALGFYEKMGGRYLRDSEPGVWGRVSAVFGLGLVPPPRRAGA